MGFLDSPVSPTQSSYEAAQNAASTQNKVGVRRQDQSLAEQQRLEALGHNYGTQYSAMGFDANKQGAQFGNQQVGQGRYNAALAQALQQRTMGGVANYESNVGSFLNNGPGPSVAQAQLAAGNDRNVANMMAMANSGRGQGGNAAAAQQAMASGAAAGQQLNQQQAILRAQEAQAYRQQQLQGYGMQLQGLGMQSDVAQNQAQMGLSQQQMGENAIQQGQAQQLQGNQLDANTTFNWAQLGQGTAQQDQAIRAQMYGQAMNADTQAQLANQQDTQKSNAAELGAIGGFLSGAGQMFGMG